MEKQKSTDPYPWLAEDNDSRNLSDKEILDKYINLETSYLTQKEKDEIVELLYKYKNAIIQRDEFGTCPNMEVETEMVDKSPLCEGGQTDPGKEMKRLVHLGILREGFLEYSSLVMLINRN